LKNIGTSIEAKNGKTKKEVKVKSLKAVLSIMAVLAFSVTGALAVDYSQYSTEELAAMRGQMRNATQEERDAFRKEWQSRIQNMDPAERSKYQKVGAKNFRGSTCQGAGYGYGRGGGRGNGHGYGRR